MWQKFTEQLPAVLLTALLVIGGAASCVGVDVVVVGHRLAVQLLGLGDARIHRAE